jgi:dipeptidyl aminopeptidase/acylaminoacyl peptidase
MSARFTIVIALFCTAVQGCNREPAPGQPQGGGAATAPKGAGPEVALTLPDFGPPRLIQPGIQFQEATLQRPSLPMRVWYYYPDKATGKLALVIVPPAGSTLFAGMDLSDGDRPEHYPYVKAGFAVASFEIDGHVPAGAASNAAVLLGARQFREARAGLDNGKDALDLVLAKAAGVDPARIYVAGHSSAATLALLMAEHEPRLKGCVAYAPVTDVEERLKGSAAKLEQAIKGYRDFIRFSSPKTHADKLTCPLLLFHAADDTNVPVRQSKDFAELVKKTNPDVTLIIAPRGGHSASMLKEGIPAGIAWLQKQGKKE